MTRVKDETGNVYGRLTVLRQAETYYAPPSGGRRLAQWVCRCDCGATEVVVTGELLRNGRTRSCGCLKRELTRERNQRRTGERHPLWRADDVGYNRAHERTREQRGKASEHPCARCGEQAEQWAYDHMDVVTERYATRDGFVVAYSPNPDHYVALCRADHVAHDRAVAQFRRASNLAELHAAFVAGTGLTDGRGVLHG